MPGTHMSCARSLQVCEEKESAREARTKGKTGAIGCGWVQCSKSCKGKHAAASLAEDKDPLRLSRPSASTYVSDFSDAQREKKSNRSIALKLDQTTASLSL